MWIAEMIFCRAMNDTRALLLYELRKIAEGLQSLYRTMQGRSGRMNKYITYENALYPIGIRHKSWYNLL